MFDGSFFLPQISPNYNMTNIFFKKRLIRFVLKINFMILFSYNFYQLLSAING